MYVLKTSEFIDVYMRSGYAFRKTMQDEPQLNEGQAGLVDGPRLLESLFPNPVCRPSLRWLRTNQGTLPNVRIGRLIWFNPQLVKSHLDARALGKVKSR